MKKHYSLAFLLLAFSVLQVSAQVKERKALFIGIDGVRSDALRQANTPNLDALLNNGIYTYDSWHLGVTSSGPSWSTMLTGVWEAKHKITNNSYTGADFNQYPYLPTRAKEINPDLKAIQIITWNPQDDASKNTGGNVFNASWDRSIDPGDLGQGLVTATAKIQLLDPDLDFLFIHYDETDAAGHGFGFSPNVPQYMAAIEDVDRQIGEVVEALKSRANYDNEDWLILGTTDHGGTGTGHGGNSNNERHIWWYASGDNIPKFEITGEDPGSYQIASKPVDPEILANTPVLADIAVTVLDWLLPTMKPDTVAAWNLDGKSWLPDSLSVVDNTTSALQGFEGELNVYPNPTQNEVSVNIKGFTGLTEVSIIDGLGRRISTQSNMRNLYRFNLYGYTSGLYIVEVKDRATGMILGQQKLLVRE